MRGHLQCYKWVGWHWDGWLSSVTGRRRAPSVLILYLLWLTCTKVFNKVELLQYFLLIDLHEQFPSLNWHRYCPHKIFSEYFSQEYCLLFDLHRLGILEPCDTPVRHCLTPNLCQSVQNEQGIVKTSDNIQTLGPPAIIKVFVTVKHRRGSGFTRPYTGKLFWTEVFKRWKTTAVNPMIDKLDLKKENA